MRLLRQARDQVEADIANPRGTEDWHSAINIFAPVHSARSLQFFVDERLRAKADAIESRGGPLPRLFSVNRFRVRFQGYFRERALEVDAKCLEHRREEYGFEETRRASADVDGVNGLGEGFDRRCNHHAGGRK